MNERIAHVFNRGVDKRKIFLDRFDYLRFINGLVLLNNKEGKIRTERKNIFPNFHDVISKQQKLVEILKWDLLPNHYHLLLCEVENGGISEFTRRLGNSYTKYFNTKSNGRSGYLFQNKVQIVPIIDHRQMLYAPFYIDLNCIDIAFPGWKEDKNRNSDKIMSFLKSYEWSSYSNYCDEDKTFDFVNKSLFYELFDTNANKYEKELLGFIEEPIGIETTNPSTWHVDGWRSLKKKVR